MAIVGIYGRPYLTLENHIDHLWFRKLIPEIWAGLRLCESQPGYYLPSEVRNDDSPQYRQVKLRKEASWQFKNLSEHCSWVELGDAFSEFKKFVESLPFSEVGRIKIFVNPKNHTVPAHRDHNEYYLNPSRVPRHCNEFIWLSSSLKKRLHLVDDESSERIVMDAPVVFFNEVDLHASDPIDEEHFSIRIDGQFTSELRKNLGLPERPMY